jgi:hypothetical protein
MAEFAAVNRRLFCWRKHMDILITMPGFWGCVTAVAAWCVWAVWPVNRG